MLGLVALVRTDVSEGRQFLQEPHSITSQKMAFFKSDLIVCCPDLFGNTIIGLIFMLQLIDNDGLVMGEKCVTLHPKQSHPFRVNFKPQEIGAAYAKLVFVIQGIHLIVSDLVYLFCFHLIVNTVAVDVLRIFHN
jgi:hypothetical protein